MSNELEQLRFSQWILERNLAWIAASEIKAGFVVTIDTAMLGVLITTFSSLPSLDRTAWASLLTVMASACLLGALVCIATSILPRLNGPKSSSIFFGCICKKSTSEFEDDFRSLSTTELLNDCLAQIHRNAEIANEKFQLVRKGMIFSFLAIPFWLSALALLIER